MADIYVITLIDNVTVNAKRAAESTDQLSKKLRDAAKEAEKTQKAFGAAALGIATAIGDLAAHGIEAFASAFVDGLEAIGHKLFETAELASRSKLAFHALFGGISEGDEVMQHTLKLAEKFGFSVDDALSSVMKFASFGFSGTQSEGLLMFGGDLRALGRTREQIERILYDMSELNSIGVNGQILKSLGRNGVDTHAAFEQMAIDLNTNVEALHALQKAGKLPTGAFQNAIVESVVLKLHGDALGQAGENAANQTVGGLIDRISSKLDVGLFQAVLNAEPALVHGLQSVFSGLGGVDATNITESLTSGLQQVGAWLDQLGPKLPGIAENFAKAFGSISGIDTTSVSGFIDQLPTLATKLGEVAGYLVKIAEALAHIAANVFSAPTNPYQSTLPGASLGLDRNSAVGGFLAMTPGGLVNSIGDFYSDFFTAGKNLSDGMADGVRATAPTVAAAVTDMAAGASDAASKALDSHSPSRVFQDHGIDVGEGMAIGIDDAAHLAAHASSALASDVIAASVSTTSSSASSVGGAAGASISDSRRSVNMGDINVTIPISGAGEDAGAAAGNSVRSYFGGEFFDLLDRHLESVGA